MCLILDVFRALFLLAGIHIMPLLCIPFQILGIRIVFCLLVILISATDCGGNRLRHDSIVSSMKIGNLVPDILFGLVAVFLVSLQPLN